MISTQAALSDIPKSAQTVRRLILATTTAAACLAVFLTVRNQPKDTFDDPHLAYAELEKTFSYISSKVDKGLEIASEAEPVFTKTAVIFGNTPGGGKNPDKQVTGLSHGYNKQENYTIT